MNRRRVDLRDADGNTVAVKGRNADRVVVIQLCAVAMGVTFDELLAKVNELLANA